jgi:hypothetical protein
MPVNDKTCNENATDFCWVSDHWWSSNHELRSGSQVVASVHINGSVGIAEVARRRYALKRFRLPPYITIRDAETDELVARLCLIPKHGFLAEFEDGQCFRLGWTNWLKREWSWTSDEGGTVVLSHHPWWGEGIEVRIGPDPGIEPKWPLLAALELATAKLALPWF